MFNLARGSGAGQELRCKVCYGEEGDRAQDRAEQARAKESSRFQEGQKGKGSCSPIADPPQGVAEEGSHQKGSLFS